MTKFDEFKLWKIVLFDDLSVWRRQETVIHLCHTEHTEKDKHARIKRSFVDYWYVFQYIFKEIFKSVDDCARTSRVIATSECDKLFEKEQNLSTLIAFSYKKVKKKSRKNKKE